LKGKALRGLALHGEERLGLAVQGAAWICKAMQGFPECLIGYSGNERFGRAWQGAARVGGAALGMEWQG